MMAFFTKFCDVGIKPKYQFSMNPVLKPGQSRLVLTWSDKPKDLDIYVLAPHSDPTKPPCEVNWRAKACHSGAVRLDRDDTDGGGPETISILKFNPGTYVVRIDEYKAKPGSLAQALAHDYICIVHTCIHTFAYAQARTITVMHCCTCASLDAADAQDARMSDAGENDLASHAFRMNWQAWQQAYQPLHNTCYQPLHNTCCALF
jgi:hypothetical protein